MPQDQNSEDDLAAINTVLQFTGGVLDETMADVRLCRGRMSGEELAKLYRRYGGKLLDPRIREDARGREAELDEILKSDRNWMHVELTPRQVWFICDELDHAPSMPEPVRIPVKGLQIIVGGEYVVALSKFLPAPLPHVGLSVQLYHLPASNPLTDRMIKFAGTEAYDWDRAILKRMRENQTTSDQMSNEQAVLASAVRAALVGDPNEM